MQKKMYDLTNPQKLIWYTEEFFKGTPIENITGSVIIPEKVDFKLLEKAINTFVEKNDSFRLKFVLKNTDIYQYVDNFSEFSIDIVNVASDEELKDVEGEISSTVFNVLDSFLYLFKMIKFPDGHGGFIINMHHLISDAWSAGLGASEIIKIYTLLLNNQSIDNIVYPSYIDYINSETSYLQSDKFNKDKAFWNDMFETVPEVATIPTSLGENRDTLVGKSNREQFTIPHEVINSIYAFCKNSKISAFNFFMAVFSLYIGRTSGLDEFVIGSPILNRGNVKEKHTSGMFISTVPLKVSLTNNITFTELASNISSNFFSIFKHQKYPYLSLLSDLRKKDNSIPNLYNVLISYQNIRSTANTSEIPYKIKWVPNNYTSNNIDIHIYDMNDTGNINIAYDYQIAKHTSQDILNIHARILNIINQILSNNEIVINDIEIVTPEEKNKILNEFNNTKVDYPKNKTISQLFEEQVQKTPNNIALVFEDKTLTYRELNEKANSLAYYLRKNDVGRNNIVGIMVNRSFEMIIGILAVLKAGGAYLPIDPEYPQDRIEYMLSNSGATILLTQKSLENKLDFNNKIFIDLSSSNIYNLPSKNLENINKPEDLSYVIYTSGSTGLPKGVMLKNINIVNFIYAIINKLNFTHEQTIISITTISFDIFVLESLLPLSNGMKIVIASEIAQTDANVFWNLCQKHNVDIIQTTPSRIQAFLFGQNHLEYINNIKFMLIGGEPFPQKLLKELHSIYPGKIYNMYGPTETAVWSSIKDLTSVDTITIGKPIANTQMYILDKFHRLLPQGVPGELYIGGNGVCKGYLKNMELTNKTFFPNPFINAAKIYKTGDLCKLLPDGEIAYLERIDNQVKVHGLRIELGEIEASISTYPDINKCIVVVNSDQKIIAYFSANRNINTNDLKSFLQRKLPKYFIPNVFVQVTKFKMTPNGKIDLKAMAKQKIEITTEYEEPSTDFQKELAEIFKKILNLPKISINDNFFEIGGDSLSAIKLQIEAFNSGIDLSYKDIFNYPTIKLLSQNITKTEVVVQEEDYDYTEISNLILKNSNPNKPRMKVDNIKNILLTGATGFMGSHILDCLIKNTRSNIYCLIRAKNNQDPQTRLLDTLRFYFGNKYDKLLFKRIFAIEGDISKPRLGLNNLYYNEIGNTINCVINGAAIVKHYGNSTIFNDTNITGTHNLIKFCENFNCKLIHLSTLSVSGNIFNSSVNYNKNVVFSEKDLFINQDLSNIYIKTKFLSERLVLENIIHNNLNAKIIRLGNITNRYSDGAFQVNISENAFINRIRSFIQIGSVPTSLRNLCVEFTPVDICADAVVNLVKYKNDFTIFHVFNNNTITFEELIRKLAKLGIVLDFVDDTDFSKRVKFLAQNENTKNLVTGIINDFSKNKKIEYVTNIKMDNTFTNKYLKRLLFRWPKINEKYILKYISYLKSIKYI